MLDEFLFTDQAKELFNKKAELCSPPLSDSELEAIWQSALKTQGLSQDLANRQVEEADIVLKKALDEMKQNGAR